MVKNEIIKLLYVGVVYPISDHILVCLVHYVPNKGDMTDVPNEQNDLILLLLIRGWCICMDYKKLNSSTLTESFSMLFMHHMLDRLAGEDGIISLKFILGPTGYLFPL